MGSSCYPNGHGSITELLTSKRDSCDEAGEEAEENDELDDESGG